MRDGEIENGRAWFCFDLEELEWLYALIPSGDGFKSAIAQAITKLDTGNAATEQKGKSRQ